MPRHKVTPREKNKIITWIILGAGTFIAIEPLINFVQNGVDPVWQVIIGLSILGVGAYLFNLND